jgi:Tfp pilus assembly protein PilO
MKISKRERIFLIVLAVFAILIGIHRFLIVPLTNSSRDMKDQIAANQLKLRSYIQTIKRKPRFEVQIEDTEKALELIQSRLLPGNTIGLARAELQVLLKNLATESSVTISRTDIKGETTREAFMELPVEVTITGNLEKITEFLFGIYTSGKALVVKEFEITRRRRRNVEEIQAKILVAGYIFLPKEEELNNV